MWYAKKYDPIQAGSIDGTDTDPHDNAITRASRATYIPPKHLKTEPNHTLFVGRLNFETMEATLKPFFEKYGTVSNIELIRNKVTGLSQGYAFITFTNSKDTQEAYRYAHEETLDDHIILVDYERSRAMKDWIPRRFGGGFGGKKESGQLRFGARDRPFRDSHHSNVGYEEKKSDVWKYSKRSPSKDRHRSSSGRHRSRSRERHSKHRSRSRERRDTRKSGRQDRHDDDRYSSRDRKRKREDQDSDDYSRPFRSESRYKNTHRHSK